jgi:hypothetical protein
MYPEAEEHELGYVFNHNENKRKSKIRMVNEVSFTISLAK